MITEKRTMNRRTDPDRRSWEERRRNVRRRFIVEVDEQRWAAVEARQSVRRIHILRICEDRRVIQMAPEPC